MSSVPVTESTPQELPVVAAPQPAELRLVPERSELYPTLRGILRTKWRERRARSLSRSIELAELGRATGARV